MMIILIVPRDMNPEYNMIFMLKKYIIVYRIKKSNIFLGQERKKYKNLLIRLSRNHEYI